MALRLPPSAVAFANPLTQSGSCLVQATHKRPRLACSGPNSHGYPVASARELCSVESHKARVQRRASHTPNHTPEPYPEPYLRFIPLIPTSRHGHVKKTHTQMATLGKSPVGNGSRSRAAAHVPFLSSQLVLFRVYVPCYTQIVLFIGVAIINPLEVSDNHGVNAHHPHEYDLQRTGGADARADFPEPLAGMPEVVGNMFTPIISLSSTFKLHVSQNSMFPPTNLSVCWA